MGGCQVAPFFRQAWMVSAVWVNMIGQGMTLSYTACLLPALLDSESSIKADLHTASWIVSSCGLATMLGFFVSSFLMEAYGRKIAHLIIILPGIAGWLTIYFAQGVTALLIGRILGGTTAGGTVSLGAIVIGEFSHPKYRGVFLNMKTVSFSLGGMLVHIFDHFFTWKNIAILACIPNIVASLIVLTWPETPAWLAAQGEFDRSKKSFTWLREKSEASKKEIDELIKAQRDRLSKPKVKTSIRNRIKMICKKFTRRDFLQPLLIIVVSTTLLEASCRHVFPAFALQIIAALSGDKSQSFYYTLGIDVIVTASAVSSSILVKVMKRRVLLLSTGFAAVVVLMIACIYLTLAANDLISNNHPWIPIGIFIFYFILANLGCTPIPLALLGEIFPLPHRGVGTAMGGIWIAVNLMGILQITPYLLVHFKVHGMFFIYGIIMGLSLLILYFVLPETKDRTLQEIEYHFNHGRFRDDMIDGDDEAKLDKNTSLTLLKT